MKKIVLCCKLLAVILVPYLLFSWMIVGSFTNYKANLFYLGAFVIYCAIAYFYVPLPDYSNMGLKGMRDHPGRMGDGRNRMAFYMLNILGPGRFFVLGVFELVR